MNATGESDSRSPDELVDQLGPTLVWGGRPLPGSLRLDERSISTGGTVATPATMFAPVHLVAARRPPPTPTTAEMLSAAQPALLAAAAEDGDPVQKRVGGLLDEAAASAFETLAPVDPTYDFDEYALLANSDPSNPFGGLFPLDDRLDALSQAVHANLSGLISNVVWGNTKLQLDASVVADELHKAWLRTCAWRAWNRLQAYDPDALRLGKVTPSYYTTGLVPPTREALYARVLAYSFLATAQAELASWSQGGGTSALGRLLTEAYWTATGDMIWPAFAEWPTLDPTAPPDRYPFTPFPYGEPRFGLRIVHRQRWHRQGYAIGSLVRTIPLAPKETLKVSTKVTRRVRTARGFEEATSAETTSERATTTKNADEIVREATDKLNIHADTEVSGGYLDFFEARVSGGVSNETANTSKNTKTQLNEMMSKAASRVRHDTKVTISTESETGFESTTASELTNPNDEIPVTFLYQRLQERFWVSTEIAEVNSVILVPEALPAWQGIDEDWIRDHSDTVGRVLLDERFRPVLDTITSDPPDLTYTSTPVFSAAASAATQAVAQYSQFPGQMPDLLASGQQFFAADFQKRSDLELDAKRRKHQAAGLIAHVRRNILYYLRAIWASEDYDQRIQRHGRQLVPTVWAFVPKAGGSASQVEGSFVPDPTSLRPLSDVADPNGPIGWLFNCAIYRLRDDPKLVNLQQALAHVRVAYARFAVTVTVLQGAAVTVRQVVVHDPLRFADSFALTWDGTVATWRLLQTLVPAKPALTPEPDGSWEARGVRLWIDGQPKDGDRIDIELRVTGEVEDPHLRLVQMIDPLPPDEQQAAMFTVELLSEMARVMPDLGLPTNPAGWTDLNAASQALVLANYHRYLVLRDSGRLVSVDTANVLLDVKVSQGATLEPFKRLHRYIDVLKEEEERRRRHLDNERRARLLDVGKLADPDIERVIVADTKADALVALDDDQ